MNLKKYKLIEGIYFPENHDSNDFNYSDGNDFEQELYDLISFAQDKSLFSKALTDRIVNWPTFCHLSPVRANLLRPVSAILKGKVLEMGSGCGILTRYLGEIGSEVVALEASAQRSRITRARTSDLNNVTVICDRIESFQTSSKFDIVTMIGVLQYSRIFTQFQKNAEIKILQAAIDQLAEDGVLIIAIQNKLGLKYFAGCPEGNTGIPFFGIENQYHDKSIIRFDQQEIRELLTSLGLEYQQFLYPFPDYHMPKSILNDKGINDLNPFFVSDIIAPSMNQDKRRPDWVTPNFMLESAWETICKAGLTSNLANAFLILASKSDKHLRSFDKDRTLVWHYSTDRPAEYATEKQFQSNELNEIVIKGKKVCEKKGSSNFITHTLSDSPYIEGRIYWSYFINIVKNPQWQMSTVANWALKWMQLICKEANIPDLYNINLYDQQVDGKFYDCTPFNCVQDEHGNLHLIDMEWNFEFKMKIIVIFTRGIIGSFLNITKINYPGRIETEIIGLIVSLFKELNIEICESLIKAAFNFDMFCQRIIHENWKPMNISNYTSKLNQELVDEHFQLYFEDNSLLAHLKVLPA